MHAAKRKKNRLAHPLIASCVAYTSVGQRPATNRVLILSHSSHFVFFRHSVMCFLSFRHHHHAVRSFLLFFYGIAQIQRWTKRFLINHNARANSKTHTHTHVTHMRADRLTDNHRPNDVEQDAVRDLADADEPERETWALEECENIKWNDIKQQKRTHEFRRNKLRNTLIEMKWCLDVCRNPSKWLLFVFNMVWRRCPSENVIGGK